MDLESLWWIDGTEYDPDSDDELGNIFGDIVSGLHTIAAAPVKAVAAILPGPAKKAINASIAATNPANVIDSKARAATKATVADASKAVSGAVSSVPRAIFGPGSKSAKTVWGIKPASTGATSTSSADTFAKLKGVQDILTTVKPRLSAKSSTSDAKIAGDQALAAMVSAAVASKLSPDLASIKGQLGLAANQRQATAEHLDINAQKDFRRKVLADLMRISTNLPANHPTRVKIRKIGLMSGLL